jgi:dockerin type I repeat protein
MLAASAASAVYLQMNHLALGATETWTTISGSWATGANWNSGSGPVPGAGDTVDITDDDNTSRTITYNYIGSAITLNSLTVDNDGAIGINTLSMTSTGVALAAGNEYVGDSNTSDLPGYGVLIQSVGTNTTSYGLYLGTGADDSGFYTLSGGAALSSPSEYIGSQGNGTLTQTGGTNTANTQLILGLNGGSAGTYLLRTGAILSSNEEFVGGYGNGVFNQTGGTNTTGALFMSEGSFGTYTLSGGSLLVTGDENVGYSVVGGAGGSATFSQTGGTNTTDGNCILGNYPGSSGTYSQSAGTNMVAGALTLGNNSGSSGQYTLSGTGSLSVTGTASGDGEYIGDGGTGTFDQTGGTNTVSGELYVGYGGSGTYILSGGSLPAGGEEFGGEGGGTFNQTGGTNSTGSLLMGVLGTGAYSLSGTGSFSASGDEYIGTDGNGTFNQTGGTNTTSSALILGNVPGVHSIYNLGGTGSLSVAGYEYVGYGGGVGTFNQTSGTNTASSLSLGYTSNSTGTYTFSGGALIVTGSAWIGGSSTAAAGQGNFQQSNGSATVDGTFKIWNSTGNSASLSGGTLTVGSLNTNSNPSNFTWTSGTLQLTGQPLDFTGSSDVDASLGNSLILGSGQTLIEDNYEWLYGSFAYISQSSGSSNSCEGLYIGNTSGSGVDAAYFFDGGSLTSTGASEYVGYAFSGASGGKGYFYQYGGTNSTPELDVGYSDTGVTGEYDLYTGATLSVSGNEYIGNSSQGTFNQNDGTNAITGSLILAKSSNVSGTYSLNAGQLSAASEYVGSLGSGTFVQTGGTNTIASFLGLGASTGAAGNYSLSNSGVLSASDEYVGQAGFGSFNQSEGSNTIAGFLGLASADGGTGIYNLSGGVLAAGSEFLGNGTDSNGAFTQSGGTNTIAGGGALTLAGPSGATGTYSLSAGALYTPTVYVGGSVAGPGGQGVLTVSGAGALSVSQTLTVYNTTGSGFNVNGGTASAASLNLLGTYTQTAGLATFAQITGTGQMNISGGTTTLTGGNGANQVNVLSISGTGVLDITHTSLIINYGGGPDPIASIASYIKSGYNGGGWNGPGIISSAAQTKTNGLQYGVGYADGADNVVSGLSSGQIEVMYTLLGDANLDGLVNAADFTILAANFNQPVTSWDQGDFNYDGIVNAADFTDLAANFNQSVSGADVSAGDVAALDAFAAANGISLANVPEPANGAMTAMAGLGILRRRRRR